MESSYFSSDDILKMEKRKRAAFINSLSGFKSASLIGTVDVEKNANLAIFSSIVHIGSDPALIGFISRPDAGNRHTLDNIIETQSFTINHINSTIYRSAHQTSARYPKHISEFEATGLTPEFEPSLLAPYVKESHIKYGLLFAEKYDLKINGTILVIGKVIQVIVPDHCLLPDGAIDIEGAETVAIAGLDSYHSTKRLSRLSYAKTDRFPEDIL